MESQGIRATGWRTAMSACGHDAKTRIGVQSTIDLRGMSFAGYLMRQSGFDV